MLFPLQKDLTAYQKADGIQIETSQQVSRCDKDARVKDR
jgi:hypothetical protein